MKSKGFTLVEILAVVVILAVLVVFAAPNIVGLGSKSRLKMFCSKVDNIQNAAQLYGEDNPDDIGSPIEIKTLVVKGYLKKEDDNCEFTSEKPCITDPRTQQSMDSEKVVITKKNRRMTAEFQFKEGDKAACANS